MSIEKTPAAAAGKTTGANEAKNAKGKTSASGPESSDAEGGFMAVLTGLDAPSADASPAVVEEVTPDVVDAPVDPTALLAQSTLWSLPASLPDASEGAIAGSTPGDIPATSIFNPQNMKASAAKPADMDMHSAADKPLSLAVKKMAKELLEASSARANVNAEPMGASALGALADSLNAARQERGGVLPGASPAPVPALAALVVAVPSPLEERAKDRSIFSNTPNEGFLPLQPLVASASTPAGSTGTMIAPPLEVYVAEQVKYWISNDVQNAEMKLDGLGGAPVEVSISMQGNEAQVAFRTDELNAREALEKASLHLKDMLKREGVVLTGVSVSTAGAGDQGDRDRRPRSGVRQVAVTSASPVTKEVASGSNRATGRALDLFV